jgi:hypothetical protein
MSDHARWDEQNPAVRALAFQNQLGKLMRVNFVDLCRVSGVVMPEDRRKSIEPTGIEAMIHIFERTPLLLWEHSIWQMAIRGCGVFAEQPWKLPEILKQDQGNSFWMFDTQLYRIPAWDDLFQLDVPCDLIGFFLSGTPLGEKDRLGHTTQWMTRQHPEVDLDGWLFTMTLLFMPTTEVRDEARQRDGHSGTMLTPRLRMLPPMGDGLPLNHPIYYPYLLIRAAGEFLGLKYTHVEADNPPRHARRRYLRENKHEPPPVRVIHLRRPEKGSKKDVETGAGEEAGTAGEAHPVDWSCRWWVAPHWRNQYHPSSGERRPKYIGLYYKGPDDKPFREQRPKVTIADR